MSLSAPTPTDKQSTQATTVTAISEVSPPPSEAKTEGWMERQRRADRKTRGTSMKPAMETTEHRAARRLSGMGMERRAMQPA